MSSPKITVEERRARLERKANVIRSRLLRTIDEIDTRRHQVAAIAKNGRRLMLPAAAAVVGGALIAAGVIFGVRRLFAKKETFSDQARKVIGGFRVPKQPSIFNEAVRRLVLTSVTVIVGEAARRGAKGFFETRFPPLLTSGK